MATQKALKLKEDAHRKLLEDSLVKILQQQKQIIDLLKKMMTGGTK